METAAARVGRGKDAIRRHVQRALRELMMANRPHTEILTVPRFGKQDFRYVAEQDVYICPAGERLAYSFTTEDKGLVLHRYATKACQNCAIKNACTTAKQRLISRWEHEHVLEAVQRRLDEHPEKMRQRRETVEHPFGTIKAWMGA